MASFSSFLTTKKFPSFKTIRPLLRGPLTYFSVAFYGILFLLCAAVFALIITINSHFLITVPARGGNLTEGVIGAPHFINPVLATTPTDQRLVEIVYSSLMQETKSYTVSPDGMTYTLSLIPGSKFSDGKPLTSNDVAFTLAKLEDSTISSQSAYWQGITVTTPDANTVIFTLTAPNPSFLSHLNFGILPQHIWNDISDQSFAAAPENLHPIGSGLMKVSSIEYQNSLPATVVLTRNKYAATKILLDSLTIESFANQSLLLSAINEGAVDFTYSLTPDTLSTIPLASDLRTAAVPTGDSVSIYRSAKDTSLSSAVISTINQSVDKNALIATVQDGYGTPAGALKNTTASSGISKGFSLAVENDPTLLLAAQTFAKQMAQAGIAVSVNAFNPGTLKQAIANGTVTLFLAPSSEKIPSEYASAIPLYNESLPYIFNATTHTIPPSSFRSPSIEYEHLQDWYTNTNKLWRWFINNNKNN